MASFSSASSIEAATAARRQARQSLPGVVALASLLLGGPAHAAAVHELIASDSRFGIFAAALQRTPLWTGIRQEGSVTLFIPSDKALRDEGSAFLLEQVLIAKSNEERLQEVLSYHLYPGLQVANQEIQDGELPSIQGACFLLSRSGSAIRIGPEAVVTEYIPADNGGIYLIDRLLWQPWDRSRHCADRGHASSAELIRLEPW